MSSHDPVAPSLSGHLRTLGICWIVYGVIRLIMAVCLVIYGSTATVMFGTLLNRVPDPLTLMGVFHSMYTVMIALSAVCGILGLMAGLALLAERRSGRTLALVAGFLSLSNIPLGTTLGIYTLVMLLPIAATQRYGRSEGGRVRDTCLAWAAHVGLIEAAGRTPELYDSLQDDWDILVHLPVLKRHQRSALTSPKDPRGPR
jgi:uncharacterized membrane protein